MNNSGFVQIDDESKIRNILDILNKRCNGKIRHDILHSVTNRLNPSKQMTIEVVNTSEAKKKMRTGVTTIVNKGCVESINVNWCRCVLGNANIGKRVVIVEDGVERVMDDVDTDILSLPLIMQVESQDLDSIKLNTTILYICM